LLQKILEHISIPFVLHGASGNDAELKKVVANGVKIINIGTDVKVSFTQAVIRTALANQAETDPRYLLTPGIEAVQAVVEQKIELFGSSRQTVHKTSS